MTEIIIAILLQIMTITGDKPTVDEKAKKENENAKKENTLKGSGGVGDWKEG